MTSKVGTAVAATAALFLAAAPPALARDHHHRDHHRRDYHHHRDYRHHGDRHHRGNIGAGIAGFAAGAALGALASHPHDYGRGYYAYQPSPRVRWCMRHYRSYDLRTHTYLGYDGHRHRCP